jgi:hypothetical protein
LKIVDGGAVTEAADLAEFCKLLNSQITQLLNPHDFRLQH